MSSPAETRRALLVALLALWVPIAVFTGIILRQTNGHLVYVLDDAYIHMAMAKSFAGHGVWGITPHEFTSSSSSLLWTLLLAGIYRVTGGPNEVTPFALNVIAATGLIVIVWRLFVRHRLPALVNAGALIAIIYVAPLPLLLFGGQEHILHALITLLFAYYAATLLSPFPLPRITGKGEGEIRVTERFEKGQRTTTVLLVILAPLLTMIRYEGLFLLAVVCALLFVRRRIGTAIAVASLGVTPVALYGFVSMAQGWYFLPNSVLLKGDTPDLSSLMGIVELLGFAGYKKLSDTPELLALLFGAMLVLHLSYESTRQFWRRSSLLLLITVATSLIHLQFAQTGWFYRYTAYLVILGLVALTIALQEYVTELPQAWRPHLPSLRNHGILAAAVAFGGLSLGLRALLALMILPAGIDNIYQQQYQMGRFLQRYYAGETVAVNDIGAVSYLGEVRTLDIWGLANKEVARARQGDYYDSNWIAALAAAEQTTIAILYADWFESKKIEGVPAHWKSAGEWRIANRVVSGGDTVTFYAVEPSAWQPLVANLQAFASRLPDGVVQTGPYVEQKRVHRR